MTAVTRPPRGSARLPGGSLDILVSAYDTPDLPKVAGGYFAREDMDLLDVFVGAEGKEYMRQDGDVMNVLFNV